MKSSRIVTPFILILITYDVISMWWCHDLCTCAFSCHMTLTPGRIDSWPEMNLQVRFKNIGPPITFPIYEPTSIKNLIDVAYLSSLYFRWSFCCQTDQFLMNGLISGLRNIFQIKNDCDLRQRTSFTDVLLVLGENPINPFFCMARMHTCHVKKLLPFSLNESKN